MLGGFLRRQARLCVCTGFAAQAKTLVNMRGDKRKTDRIREASAYYSAKAYYS